MNLNKNRLLLSKLLGFATLLYVFFMEPIYIIPENISIIIKHIGLILASLCGLGRLYSIAFIGGHKSKKLIDYGPFSICRNPLYFFSFIGVIGLTMATDDIIVMIIVPILYLLIYFPLIKREENFLTEKFGKSYIEYCNNIPQFIPNLKKYKSVKIASFNVHSMNKALTEVIWWVIVAVFIDRMV